MLEFIAGSVALVVGGLLLLALVVALPVLLIVGLFKLLFGLILLPFRILGLLFGAVAGLFLVLFKIAFFFLLVLAFCGLFAGGALTIALAPLILLGLAVWLLVRLLRPRSPVSVAGA